MNPNTREMFNEVEANLAFMQAEFELIKRAFESGTQMSPAQERNLLEWLEDYSGDMLDWLHKDEELNPLLALDEVKQIGMVGDQSLALLYGMLLKKTANGVPMTKQMVEEVMHEITGE